jgi:hypothetical protein
MVTVVETAESNNATPEGEPDDDIITIASEIASRDMGIEGPPPPPPSQRELRDRWGHLPDDMEMSAGGLPMPAKSPPVPQSIIDRNSAGLEPTKMSLLDRLLRKNPAELPPLQPRAVDAQTITVPENAKETIKPRDMLSVDDSGEKARDIIFAKIDAAQKTANGNTSGEEQLETVKYFQQLRDWLTNSASLESSTAKDYVDLLKKSAVDAREQLKQLDSTEAYGFNRNETRVGVDTIPERNAQRSEIGAFVTSAEAIVNQYLPTIVEPEEDFPSPPPPHS